MILNYNLCVCCNLSLYDIHVNLRNNTLKKNSGKTTLVIQSCFNL